MLTILGVVAVLRLFMSDGYRGFVVGVWDYYRFVWVANLDVLLASIWLTALVFMFWIILGLFVGFLLCLPVIVFY